MFYLYTHMYLSKPPINYTTDKTEAKDLAAVAPCKKLVIGEKAGEKPMECTIIPGQEVI
jgi:hypothetical protein